ncbi:hypothetical protein CBW46_016460 [Paenibacillus xerothermodurans]|uniref:Uncharacterized protein n=1 Tax=Paenibacillus xerothermodurans TaxID=1977292 RepID=A0A2W1N7C9_PAEXE|nr:hypothetical protein CBW46_016460 [Paenibacillus xerothermodurans]
MGRTIIPATGRVQLSDIRTMDNEMYVHALNVTMMSVLIGSDHATAATYDKRLPRRALAFVHLKTICYDVQWITSEKG